MDAGIQMIGIDHGTAGIKVREQFAFTVSQAKRAMEYVKRQPGVRGCLLLSTCNRMELWVSISPEEQIDLFSMPALLKKTDAGNSRQYFSLRKGEEAVTHLFMLTAGLKSRIFGEDQILSQVKDALKLAREIYCTDTLIEVLFRHAVTAGKEVRTKAALPHADISAAHHAIACLKQQQYDFVGKKCLVIGNGQMGKLTAQALQEEGAQVTVTVRQYKSGIVEIPKGCARIHYGERYEAIPDCDLVVSATVSPNMTICKNALADARNGRIKPQIYIDLAVPRDIEEEIGKLDGVALYDIDSFQSDAASQDFIKSRNEAEEILSQRIEEFKDWYECRSLVPRMQQIGQSAAEDICWRMGRGIQKLPDGEQAWMQQLVKESAAKAVDKLLFALRDELPREELYHCVEILEKIRYQ